MKQVRRKKVTLGLLERLHVKTLKRVEKLQKNAAILNNVIEYLKLQIKNAPQPYVKGESNESK